MNTILTLIVLILSVIVHEVAHGYAANSLGDPTARLAGRLTLNPIPHIDMMGSIIIPILLVLTGSPILFGWAKPVPYNPYNLGIIAGAKRSSRSQEVQRICSSRLFSDLSCALVRLRSPQAVRRFFRQRRFRSPQRSHSLIFSSVSSISFRFRRSTALPRFAPHSRGILRPLLHILNNRFAVWAWFRLFFFSWFFPLSLPDHFSISSLAFRTYHRQLLIRY